MLAHLVRGFVASSEKVDDGHAGDSFGEAPFFAGLKERERGGLLPARKLDAVFKPEILYFCSGFFYGVKDAKMSITLVYVELHFKSTTSISVHPIVLSLF